jgi:hypothetical protein
MVRKGKYKFKGKCFKCGQDGHIIVNYKVKKNKGEDKGECFKCGKRGYMAYNCKEEQKVLKFLPY